ncbi:uncharacterized protein K02A2.6-like [Amphibalanus amphitrite]|uniref:uncharacterized protein K02A2.6-like n=1 Tax=Amphibalanus amphitrite TaxID=1232801 RepID=UPI001C907C9D|nr:uncharacterized protein K02A2.6-like [Amphibalanus amphitrite]
MELPGMQLSAVGQYRPGEDFEKWLRNVERYLIAANVRETERKCALLQYLVGPDIADLSEALPEPAGEGNEFEKLKEKLTTYLAPVRNTVTERAEFHQMTMRTEEDFEQFLGRLRVQALRCGYTAAETDRELRDRCVVGSSPGLREKLLQETASRGKELTLENVRRAARAYRDMRQLCAQVGGGQSAPAVTAPGSVEPMVNAVAMAGRSAQPRRGQCFNCGSQQHWKRDCPTLQRGRGGGGRSSTHQHAGSSPRQLADGDGPPPGEYRRNQAASQSGRRGRASQPRQDQSTRQTAIRRCYRCGSHTHLQRRCPERAVDHLTEDSGRWLEDNQLESGVLKIDIRGERADLPLVSVRINGREIRMLVDTGSPVTIVGRDTKIPGMCVRASDLRLQTFTGQLVPLRGETTVQVEHAGQTRSLRLVICDRPETTPLLGRDWLRQLQLDWRAVHMVSGPSEAGPRLTPETVIKKHESVFADGVGKMTVKAHLALKPGARPVYKKARPVPYALLPLVDRELERWVREGIAEKTDSEQAPTGWGTPLVPVLKPTGQVRLCANYSLTVNPQLMVTPYPLPAPEDLFANIKGRVFAKLDIRRAYEHMELDQESRDLTTVTTHRGSFRMIRMPYGIANCGFLFQQAMDKILEGLDGCVCYMDDCLIAADSEQELLRRLDRALDRMERNGLRLERSKCVFLAREVSFLGWRITADSIRPEEDGTTALLDAPEPRDVQQLRSLLGSVNYYSRLLPGLATTLAPLYALLKRGTPWRWTPQCSAAVATVKRLLASGRVLVRYDPSLPLKLVTDASSTGVGATLLHQMPDGTERPIMFASRTLTPTERRYAQVEKEATGVQYGLRRFHRFLFGRRFTLTVDNRALSRILSPERDLPGLSAARLQRIAMELAAYQYDVELRKTADMALADSLSRMALPDSEQEQTAAEADTSGLDCHLMFMDGAGPPLTARELESGTRRDPLLARVLSHVRHGWPSVTEPELAPYRQRETELSTDRGVLLWGGRAVIPQRLRERVLQELHTGHLGGSKMKQLARRYLWWPGLDADLEAMARGCHSCAEKRGAPPRATLHPWEPTSGPWQRIHVDFAGPVENKYLMVVCDSHTKWVEAIIMPTTSAGRTVEELRELFARFGIPDQVVTDNGPQFTSTEFGIFLSNNGVRHIRTAPYHPASNGAAERAVGVLKSGLRATARDGGSLHQRVQKVLIAYRTAPHAVTGRPPAEVMFGRPIRTRLDRLHPSIIRDVTDSQQDQREAAGGRPREFQVGQAVWARTYAGPQRWRRGQVIGVTGPVSYQVDVGGAVWARHADQLLPAAGRAQQQATEPAAAQQQQYQLPANQASFSRAVSGGPAPSINIRWQSRPLVSASAAVCSCSLSGSAIRDRLSARAMSAVLRSSTSYWYAANSMAIL